MFHIKFRGQGQTSTVSYQLLGVDYLASYYCMDGVVGVIFVEHLRVKKYSSF